MAELALIKVEPGTTPQGEALRKLFNLPSGTVTDWFDEKIYDLPANLTAMTNAVLAASTKVKDSDTQMEIKATDLQAAFNAGSGAEGTGGSGYSTVT